MGLLLLSHLFLDFKALYGFMDDSSGLLEHIKRQVDFLFVVSFNVVRASALYGGACAVARCNLVPKDWKTESA